MTTRESYQQTVDWRLRTARTLVPTKGGKVMDAPNYATIPADDRMAAYIAYTHRKRPLDTKTKHRVAEVEVIDANHPLFRPRQPVESRIAMEGPFVCERCGWPTCDCSVVPDDVCEDDLRHLDRRP